MAPLTTLYETDLSAILPTVGAIFGLLGSGGAIWAVFRATALEASNERLRKENEDYVRRLNYIEPKFEVLTQANETLTNLRDPTPSLEKIDGKLDTLTTQEQTHHTETVTEVRNITAAIREKR